MQGEEAGVVIQNKQRNILYRMKSIYKNYIFILGFLLESYEHNEDGQGYVQPLSRRARWWRGTTPDGSIPPPAVLQVMQFRSAHIACVFRKRPSIWCLCQGK